MTGVFKGGRGRQKRKPERWKLAGEEGHIPRNAGGL